MVVRKRGRTFVVLVLSSSVCGAHQRTKETIMNQAGTASRNQVKKGLPYSIKEYGLHPESTGESEELKQWNDKVRPIHLRSNSK